VVLFYVKGEANAEIMEFPTSQTNLCIMNALYPKLLPRPFRFLQEKFGTENGSYSSIATPPRTISSGAHPVPRGAGGGTGGEPVGGQMRSARPLEEMHLYDSCAGTPQRSGEEEALPAAPSRAVIHPGQPK